MTLVGVQALASAVLTARRASVRRRSASASASLTARRAWRSWRLEVLDDRAGLARLLLDLLERRAGALGASSASCRGGHRLFRRLPSARRGRLPPPLGVGGAGATSWRRRTSSCRRTPSRRRRTSPRAEEAFEPSLTSRRSLRPAGAAGGLLRRPAAEAINAIASTPASASRSSRPASSNSRTSSSTDAACSVARTFSSVRGRGVVAQREPGEVAHRLALARGRVAHRRGVARARRAARRAPRAAPRRPPAGRRRRARARPG